MKTFIKVPVNDNTNDYLIEFDNGKKVTLSNLIEYYINKEEPKDWITIRGNHIPIMKGETKEEVAKKFLEKQEKKGLDKSEKKGYNISKGETFSDYNKKKDNPKANRESVLSSINSYTHKKTGKIYSNKDIRKIIDDVDKKLENVSDKPQGLLSGKRNTAVYNQERRKLHKNIIKDIFRNFKSKKPEKGEKPTFILLGGRGGSGKSKFSKNNLIYDKSKYLVLNADDIQEHLDGYEGWNAKGYHDEAADVLEIALKKAAQRGVNVVLDATMNGLESTQRRLKQFIDMGYRTEAHYMYLPRQEAAKRSVTRFISEGRYVPINVVLDMTENEKNFDIVKDEVDSWSFWSNEDVGQNDPPRFIKKGGKGYEK